jgi:Sigma-70 region 2
MSERRQLINLAYRLLGSLADAEDVVQETYARWYAMSRQQREAIESPGGWLTTVASRICLDLLGSARARRESYVGEWIPEPLPDRAEWINGRSGGTTADPADRVTLDESINMAFLVVLESITPAQRVAYILGGPNPGRTGTGGVPTAVGGGAISAIVGSQRIHTNRSREQGVHPPGVERMLRDNAHGRGLASSLLTSSPLEGV